MSKTIAPLLSFDARGQVAKTVVYSSWRGVKYARRFTVPANPRTIAQQRNRNIFATLREMFKLLPTLARAPWEAYSTGRQFTAMNAFVGENRLAIATGDDFSSFLGSPGARGGLPAEGIAAEPGATAGSIDVAFLAPDVPPDWTLTAYVALAFPAQMADVRFTGNFAVGSNDGSTTELTINNLPTGVSCQVAGWTVWQKPDGRPAYGPSLITEAISG